MALFFIIVHIIFKTIKLIAMKKTLLPLLAATLVFVACNTKKTDTLDTENKIVFTDTAAAKNGNASTDVGTKDTTPIVVAAKPVAAPKPQVRTITKVVKVYEKQPAPKVSKTQTIPDDSYPTPSSTTTGTTTGSGTPGAGIPGTGTTTPAKKKNTGWSDAAKDATIGGVGGAVIGGVIGKGGKGAVIGGVLGAAGGYILGRKKDKKSGRVDTTKY